MKSKIVLVLTFIFITLTAYSQENIKIYRVGSSSFGNKLAQQIEDYIVASGDYSVEWGQAGYTRLDQWATGSASYQDWLDGNMPELIFGSYDYVIFQTIGWFGLNPATQDTLFTVILPDLVQKVRSTGAEPILYDKYPSPGCYPDWRHSNYPAHIKAAVESGITKIGFGGYAMRQIDETPYFRSMASFFDMGGHPGPMTDYLSACNIGYIITGVSPIGHPMTNINMQGFCTDWFAGLETSSDPDEVDFFNANKDRVVNEYLQLTTWEADTLQNTAFRSYLNWMDTLMNNINNPDVYDSTLAYLEEVRSLHAQWDLFDNPDDYAPIDRERCQPLNAISLSEDVLLAILDTIKMFSDRVETAAQTYLSAGEYDQLKQDYEDYWQDYNSKFRDDTYYMLLVELELARADSTPDLVEIARLEEQSDVFREILSLPAEQMLIDMLDATDSAAFVSSFTWGVPLSTYAPNFGQAQLDNASDWKEVEVLREMYTDIWINNNLMDAARDNNYPLQAWIDVDDLFAAAYASFVPGYRNLEVVGNGLYQSISVTPDQTSFALGASASISTSTYLGYEFKNWSGDASGTTHPLSVIMDENKKIIANFGFVDDGIIIDNDAGFPYAVASPGTITRDDITGTFGLDVNKVRTEADMKVRFTPNFSGIEGEYQVLSWIPSGGVSSAAYVISHDGGNDTVYIDETNTSGDWVIIGTYSFSNGKFVDINGTLSNGRSYADAVRFVFTGVTYSLNITSDNGSVSRTPNKSSYTDGETVNITANPDLGYSFDSWSGDATGSANPVSITMDANKNVTANFTQNLYTITFNVDDGTNPLQNAEVTFNSTTINTDASGDAVFNNVGGGTGLAYSIVLAGYTTVNSTVNATANIAENVTMTLIPPTTYTLTVNSGTGDGDYEEAEVVNIDADAPTTGQVFDAWTGDVANVANVNAASTTITMPAAATTITATYVDLEYTITFNVDDGSNPIQNAAVTFNSTTINTDASGDAVFSNVVYGTGLAYSIVASGYNTESGTVDATADITENVTMTAVASGTYTVTFTVDDGTDPIEGASVNFNSQDVLTNTSGQAVFAGVSNGTGIAYTVSMTGYDNESGTLDVADADVDETVSLTLTPPPTYTVTITSGTGSGEYEEGVTVNITADAAPIGQEFDKWTGDTTLLSSATATATSFTMPANAVSLTANYKDIVDAICENELIFEVFPNPASNVVIVSSNVTMEYVQFININGKVVLEGDLNSQRSAINISQIPKGIYFINLNLKDNTHHIERLIKK